MISYRASICAALVALCPFNSADAKANLDQSDPIKVLQGVYGYYSDNEPMESWHRAKLTVDQDDLPYAPTFAKLYSLLMSKHNTDRNDGPCIDADLVCNCQDGTPERYRIQQIGARTESSVKYRVDMKGKDFSERSVFWTLRKVGGAWSVQDLGYGKASDSTVSYIKSCLSPKAR